MRNMQSSGEKAAHTLKWRSAKMKADRTARIAKTFAKKSLKEKGGFETVSFESNTGHEGTGIVDVVGIRRHKSSRDSLDIVLVQVKGGSARITPKERERLSKATSKVNVTYTVAEKRGSSVKFYPSPFRKN